MQCEGSSMKEEAERECEQGANGTSQELDCLECKDEVCCKG